MEKQTKLQLLIVGLCVCALLTVSALVYYAEDCHAKKIPLQAGYAITAFVLSLLFVIGAFISRSFIKELNLCVKVFLWITAVVVAIPIFLFLFILFIVTHWPV